MNYRIITAVILCIASAISLQGDNPKNIVLIVADDLGANDLGFRGSDLHETPNLDALARNGIEFTHAYAAAPVCSPTRASVLTGKYPARLKMTTWHESSLNGPQTNKEMITAISEANLPVEEVTLADVLKAAGYHTFHVGKWHLGEASFFPETQGYDVNIGGHHWGAPSTFFAPYNGIVYGHFRYVPDLHGAKPGENLTDRLTQEAIQLMESAGNEPFFLSLNYFATHVPIDGKPDLVEKYAARITPQSRHRNPGYAAMVHTLDAGVGRILEWLRQSGKDTDTILVFISDNGGFNQKWQGEMVTTNLPLRSGKGSLYEGGIRIPWLMQVPGVAKPAKLGFPVSTIDLFPTLLEYAGLDAPKRDGMSLMPLIKDTQAGDLSTRPLVFHFPHYYHGTIPVSAIVVDGLKLLQIYRPDGVEYELYDLQKDPYEKQDIAVERSADVKRLSGMLNAMLEEMQVNYPQPNPEFKSNK